MFPKVFAVKLSTSIFDPTVMIANDEAAERRVKAHAVKSSLEFIEPAGPKPTFDTLTVLSTEIREAAMLDLTILEALPAGMRRQVDEHRVVAGRALVKAVERWEVVKLRDMLSKKKIEEIAEAQEDEEFVVDSLVVRLDEILDYEGNFRGEPLIRELPAQVA